MAADRPMGKLGTLVGVLLVAFFLAGAEGFFYLGRPVLAALCFLGFIVGSLVFIGLTEEPSNSGGE